MSARVRAAHAERYKKYRVRTLKAQAARFASSEVRYVTSSYRVTPKFAKRVRMHGSYEPEIWNDSKWNPESGGSVNGGFASGNAWHGRQPTTHPEWTKTRQGRGFTK